MPGKSSKTLKSNSEIMAEVVISRARGDLEGAWKGGGWQWNNFESGKVQREKGAAVKRDSGKVA